MLASQIPNKFPIPFGNNAVSGNIRPIPVASQQSTQAGAASLTDGFPPNTFIPPSAGGTPPFGQDFNGIFQQITAWLRWMQAGGGITVYDAAFATSPLTGGYPAGAILASAISPGRLYQSLVDNNQTNPDSPNSSGWVAFGDTAGAVTWRPTNELLPGWVMANATSIGATNSTATQLAANITQNLYVWHWTNFSNTQCPVVGGRGSSALADFNALKPIQTLDMRGIGITGMDTMNGAPSTRLNGVPVSSGAINQAGSLIGENLHALLVAELAAHIHALTDPSHFHSFSALQAAASGVGAGGGLFVGSPSTQNTSSATTGITIASQGGGQAHNNVPLALTGTWYLKL
jgi:hypothetical protein